MNAEERIQDLKNIPPLSNFEKKRKIKTAIVLGASSLITMLFFVYAFVQKLEADRQLEMTIATKMEAQRQRTQAEQQRITAEYQQHEIAKQLAAALEELEKCKAKR